MKSIRFWGIILLITSFTASCGGAAAPSASIPLPSNDPTGITISQQVSFVTAQTALTSASISSFALNNPVLAFLAPTTGQYITDPVEYYVFDETMKPLTSINEILCSLDQTSYDEMVNKGSYQALVDVESCSRSQNRSDASNNQSSGQEQNFETWIVNSTRADNDSPQIVQFWIEDVHQPDGDNSENSEQQSIHAKLVITEGSTTNNPFGVFTLNATGLNESDSVTMTFVLQSLANDDGSIELQMVNIDTSDGQREEVQAILNSTADTGQALSKRFISGGDSEGEVAIVDFDENFYKTQIEDDYFTEFSKNECLNRNAFITNVFEYNLYAEDGSRLSNNTGFSIKSSGGIWGWADHYGVWFPEKQLSNTDGITVTNEQDQSFTVLNGGGRLIKRTKSLITLGSITNQIFTTYDEDLDKEFHVKWDGSNFIRLAEVNFQNGSTTITPLTPTQTITLTTDEYFHMFKEGFGDLDIVVPLAGLKNSTQLPSYTEETVDINDFETNTTLYCYYDCPKDNITAADLNNNDPFLADQDTENDPAYEYSFNPSDYSLSKGGTDINLKSVTGINPDSFFHWGMRSGFMSLTPVSKPWEAFNQNVVYQWETGPNAWNRYTALLNSSNAPVAFDPAIRCNYNDGQHGDFKLEYFGPGRLSGIPFREIKESDSGFSHWVAKFSIPDGSELSCNGTNYYTKAIIAEQFMQKSDESNCSHLTLPTELTGPSVEYEDPNIGDAPTVTEDPKVISGVLTSTDS